MTAFSTGTETLAYEVRGSGNPLVFLHGLTFDRASWQPVVERLSGEFRCVTVDLPGHGATPGPPRRLTDVAAELRTLLDALDVERPLLVGHSMGAVLAVLYAGRHPVSGVVTVDQSLDVRPFARLVKHLEPTLRAGFDEAFEPFDRDIGVDRLPASERRRVANGRHVRGDVVMGYWHEVLESSPEELQGRLEGAARSVATPVLVIFGRALEGGEESRLRRVLPAAELEEWPGRGHLVHLVEPDRFAHRLGSFARQCFEPSPAYDPSLAANRAVLVGVVGRCLNGHNLDALSLYTDNPRVAASLTSAATGFPDARCRVEWVIAEGDMVSAWLAMEGTHLGVWRGMAPTGRPVSVRASLTVKVVDGRIADFWLCADWLRMYRQLGASISEA
jgi:pimeloyl-ACP methyl ester carboxylesterase/predicted ester cyclase